MDWRFHYSGESKTGVIRSAVKCAYNCTGSFVEPWKNLRLRLQLRRSNMSQCCGAGAGRSRYFLVGAGAGVKMWRQKHFFYYILFSPFLYEKEPEPVKKSTWSRSRSKKDRLRNTACIRSQPNYGSGTLVLPVGLLVEVQLVLISKVSSAGMTANNVDLNKKQCCISGMIYSGSSSEFSEFRIRIQAKVPDPCGSGSNPCYLSIFGNC